MKPMTIWQRLDRALLLLILLLLGGVGTAIWAALSCSNALEASSALTSARYSIDYQVMVLG